MDYPKHDYVMELEGLHKVCKYSTEKGKNDPANPHTMEKRDFTKKIKDNITDCIGNTPMVRLGNIMEKDGLKCELCK
jgi:hypothetical protein